VGLPRKLYVVSPYVRIASSSRNCARSIEIAFILVSPLMPFRSNSSDKPQKRCSERKQRQSEQCSVPPCTTPIANRECRVGRGKPHCHHAIFHGASIVRSLEALTINGKCVSDESMLIGRRLQDRTYGALPFAGKTPGTIGIWTHHD
jgi:hypothetical protein